MSATGSPAAPERPATPQANRGLYGSPGQGLKAVQGDYLYWTGRLTDSSLQLSFAVIAANWAVFGSVQGILTNLWAKCSLAMVLLSLVLALLGAKVLSELHRQRVEYAESDLARWAREYSEAQGRRDVWPFTKTIEQLGWALRELRTWLPLAAGASFIVALFAR